MKKIFLALMVCFMFAGAGYCAPKHHHGGPVIKHHPPKHHISYRPVVRHKHHPKIYRGSYRPVGTTISIGSNGVYFSIGRNYSSTIYF